MLKRTGYILIMLLLLFGTTGLTIYKHYCGSDLIQTSIFTPQNCCNGHCPGCHNEKINLRISDKFETSQARIDFTAGFKTLLEQHTLPTLLAFSTESNIALFNDVQGDHSIKSPLIRPRCAGPSTPLLQVFLF